MKLLLLVLALSACAGDPNLAAPVGPQVITSPSGKPAGTTDQPTSGGATCLRIKTGCR